MLFVVLAKPRMVAIEQALAAEKEFVSQTFHALVNDPILWISIHTCTAILLGIVFLKIAKPDVGFLPQTEARIVCSINPLYSTEICHFIAGRK